MSKLDFVVVGFPKCGTSALMRDLERIPGVVVQRRGPGLESPFFLSDDSARAYMDDERIDPSRINGHKYAAYIYDRAVIRRILSRFPRTLVMVCVRDPGRALLSWREMHRETATSGRAPEHFTYKNPASRRFYAEATIDAYFDAFARTRLQYATHLRNLAEQLGDARMVVIEQSILARDPVRVRRCLADALGVKIAAGSAGAAEPARPPHVGFADRASLDDASAELRAAIDHEREQLARTLDELEASGTAVVLR